MTLSQPPIMSSKTWSYTVCLNVSEEWFLLFDLIQITSNECLDTFLRLKPNIGKAVKTNLIHQLVPKVAPIWKKFTTKKISTLFAFTEVSHLFNKFEYLIDLLSLKQRKRETQPKRP